jgi:hypothetical protein
VAYYTDDPIHALKSFWHLHTLFAVVSSIEVADTEKKTLPQSVNITLKYLIILCVSFQYIMDFLNAVDFICVDSCILEQLRQH